MPEAGAVGAPAPKVGDESPDAEAHSEEEWEGAHEAPDEFDTGGPSEEDMAAMYGGGRQAADEELSPAEADEASEISVEDAEKALPAKTKALMEELFRARVQSVRKVDPKRIK